MTEELLSGPLAAAEPPLQTAFRKLDAALRALEDAAERRLEEDSGRGDVDVAVQRLGADRSRLAQSLDASEARAARLEDANRDVARRLVAAMEEIRAVVAAPP